MRTSPSRFSEALTAAIPAAVLSGAPSTLHALWTGRDPFEATTAAGSILLPGEQSRSHLLLAAIPVHVALSLGWAFVLSSALPRRRPVTEGTIAGLAIALLDLGIVGRIFPRIKALKTFPQVADHIAFGVIVATTLKSRDKKGAVQTTTFPWP